MERQEALKQQADEEEQLRRDAEALVPLDPPKPEPKNSKKGKR